MYAWVVQLQVQLAGATVSFSGAGGDGRRDVVVVGCWTRLPLAAWRLDGSSGIAAWAIRSQRDSQKFSVRGSYSTLTSRHTH